LNACPYLATSFFRYRPRVSDSIEVTTILTQRDGAKQLAAHLVDGSEHMLDPRPRPGDAHVAPLQAVGQRLIPMTLPLDLVPKAVFLQPGLALRRRIAPVGIDVPAGVDGVEDVLEVLAVVCACSVGLDLADDLVFRVDVDGELVAEVTLAVLRGPGGIKVLLAPLGGLPAGGLTPCSIKSFSSRLLCCLGAGTRVASMI
jgi:hypothetical protein